MQPYYVGVITVSSAAIGIPAAAIAALKPFGRVSLTLTVETNSIRYYFSGDTPTASVGHLANITDVIFFDQAEDILNFLMIRTAAPDATVTYTLKSTH